MENNPLVSILIPNYNKATYLKETLDSVLNQTYTNWECIIVDDHSTDSSWDILEEFAQMDSRFKIYKRPDNRKQGGNAARNYAFEMSKGEYLFLLDSDDMFLPNRILNAINFLFSSNSLAIYSGTIVKYKDKAEKFESRSLKEKENPFEFLLFNNGWAPTPTFAMHSSVFNSVKFNEDFRRHQDFDFFIRVHESVKWTYFENFDVVVNWSRPNIYQINYDFCLPFYKKYLKEINIDAIKYILKFSSQVARHQPNAKILKYFDQILQNNFFNYTIKQWILFKYPTIFHYFSKIKNYKF